MSTARPVLQSRGLILHIEDGEPYREFWFSAQWETWVDGELLNAVPQGSDQWEGDSHPYEQVFLGVEQYVYNAAYRNTGQIVNLVPQSDGLWEIKTADVRMFGWFYRRRVFVAHTGELKAVLSDEGYSAHVKLTAQFRRSLNLPPPAFIYNRGWLPRDYL